MNLVYTQPNVVSQSSPAIVDENDNVVYDTIGNTYLHEYTNITLGQYDYKDILANSYKLQFVSSLENNIFNRQSYGSSLNLNGYKLQIFDKLLSRNDSRQVFGTAIYTNSYKLQLLYGNEFSRQIDIKYLKTSTNKIQTLNPINNVKISRQTVDDSLIVINLQKVGARRNNVTEKRIVWNERKIKNGSYEYSRNINIFDNVSTNKQTELLDYFYQDFYISYRVFNEMYDKSGIRLEDTPKDVNVEGTAEIVLESDVINMQLCNIAKVNNIRQQWISRGTILDTNYLYWRNIKENSVNPKINKLTNETVEKVYKQD